MSREPLKRHTPLLAKLGVAILSSSSIVGVCGFLASTLNKQAAQFLAVSVGSALSATLLTVWTIRYRGVVTLLPPEVEEPLLNWDLLQTIRYVNSSLDVEAAKKMAIELAPLALVKDDVETKRAVSNMSSEWQRILTTKGLLGLLPPSAQKLLLPKNSPILTAPSTIPVGRSANLTEQTALFQELAILRLTEIRDDLAERSFFFWLLKVCGQASSQFYTFVKQNTSSDLQVTVIMSVLVLLMIRGCLMFAIFILRRALGILSL